jgi:hypothetical protein
MSVGDVYQLRMNTFHPANDDNLNVFYYRSISETDPLDAEKVYDAFVLEVIPNIVDAMTDLVDVNLLTVTNGTDNGDFFEANPGAAGTGSIDEPTAPFIAMGLRSARDGPGTRHTYKRFIGCTAINMNSSLGRFTPAYQVRLESIAGALALNITPVDAVMEPVQLAGGFRLGFIPVVNFVLSGQWEFNSFPTHQDTRQQYIWKVAP